LIVRLTELEDEVHFLILQRADTCPELIELFIPNLSGIHWWSCGRRRWGLSSDRGLCFTGLCFTGGLSLGSRGGRRRFDDCRLDGCNYANGLKLRLASSFCSGDIRDSLRLHGGRH
jgi:hypothetical protein